MPQYTRFNQCGSTDTSLKKSHACILEFQCSGEQVLKADVMANGIVEHMTSEDHLSGADFRLGS